MPVGGWVAEGGEVCPRPIQRAHTLFYLASVDQTGTGNVTAKKEA